ncbi:hypothetical protein [Marinomonas sp. GJ51-6]|uniref:hypothetical protein n=1 Tax=Marinomonas sp. GJ51-6 TaxID=2992802 RepID=UPI0029346840|nr:hypothetical protein [Marinomonas sp. GJ51-6]WOD06170.1 hypothetical protein ONZ50_10510 [Marinomonas sp. GJ51-6]
MEQLLKQYLPEQQPLGQIIYAGVGSATLLDWLMTLDFKTMQLIEPLSSVVARLKKRYATDNLVITQAAVSNVTGVASFTHTQPAKYSSLSQEIDLAAVLKNSKIKNTESVKTVSLSDVIQASQLNVADHNVLILSVNGAELEALSTVPMEALTVFSAVFIQVDNQGIYRPKSNNNADVKASLKASLKEKGFYFEEGQAETIFSYLYFKRDDQFISTIDALKKERDKAVQSLQMQREKYEDESEQQQAKATADWFIVNEQNLQQSIELDVIKQERGAIKAELEQYKAQLAERTQQRDQQAEHHQKNKQWAESLKVQLEQAKQELENTQSLLTAEQEKVKAEQSKLKAEQGKAQVEQTRLQTALADAEKAQETSQAALNNKQTELEQHKAQLAERTQQRDQQAEHHQKNKQWAESLKVQLEQAKQELENTQSLLTAEQEKVKAEQSKLKAEQEKAQVEQTRLQTAFADAEKAQETSQAALNNKQTELEQHKAQLAERTQQRDEYSEQYQKHKEWAESLKVKLEQTKADIEVERKEVKAELQEARRSASLGQKMMAKAQIDLEDLREKYAKKMTSEQELVSLVKELKGKLTLASKYYFQLQKEHPELLSSQSVIEDD